MDSRKHKVLNGSNYSKHSKERNTEGNIDMKTYLYNDEMINEVKEKIAKVKGSKTVPISSMAVGLQQIPIIDLINARVENQLGPYPNNRGTGDVNSKTVNDVLDNLSLHSIGEFVAAPLRSGRLTIGDGHGRLEGLIRRLIAGRLTETERNFPVGLRVVPASRFSEVYEKANSSEKHKAIEKLKNTDYFFGSLIGALAEIMGDAWKTFIRPKFYKQISYLLYTYRAEAKLALPKYIRYSNIFSCRKDTTPLELCQKKDSPFSVSATTLANFDKGARFYVETMMLANQRVSQMDIDSEPLKRLTTSAPFMAMIVSDQMSGMCDFGESSICLANRIVRNMSKLSDLSKGLTHSSEGDTAAHESDIRKILIAKPS